MYFEFAWPNRLSLYENTFGWSLTEVDDEAGSTVLVPLHLKHVHLAARLPAKDGELRLMRLVDDVAKCLDVRKED
jgi:hypothetical protein